MTAQPEDRRCRGVGVLAAAAALLLAPASPVLARQTDEAGTSRAASASTFPEPSTWKGALAASTRLLMIEHTTRILFQEKTRRELGGPFFEDYVRSVKVPKTWNDGDSWSVNYIGHPIHGAAAGFIWLDHDTKGRELALGSKTYWASRGRATAWAAAYSVQFEFGPLSEASIGNVGMHPETTGWIDHVVTPAGALGFIVAEDVLDRYLVVRIEHWTTNRLLRAATRVVFNPSRALSNIAEGRMPWDRTARPLR